MIANKIVRYSTPLTSEYLKAKGWIMDNDGFFIEPNIKDRDRISIVFGDNIKFYRVYHSEKRTFICIENSIEWFELYYLLLHGDNGRYELSNI